MGPRMWFRKNKDGTYTRMKDNKPIDNGTRQMAERDTTI